MYPIIAARKYLSLLLALTLVLFLPAAVPSQAAPADVTFTVNSNWDYDPGAVNGACSNGPGGSCGLREAIKEANAASGNKTINFSTGMAGLTINLSNAAWGGSLFLISDNITINGYTSGGNVTIDTNLLSANNNLFEVQGDSNTILGLLLHGWSGTLGSDFNHGHGVRIYDPISTGRASHNTLDGLRIYNFERDGVLISGDAGGGGHGNTIVNSLIGNSDWGSTSCSLGNRVEGIAIINGADNNNINYNNIVCNSNNGISLDGNTGGQITGTAIQYNFIGTNGSVDMGNGSAGVVDIQASNTIINNNVISGNGHEGVWLLGSIDTILNANRIGVDQNGEIAIPNDSAGIDISDFAHGVAIGSPYSVSARNTISGNAVFGVYINSGAYNNVLDGNYIGLGGPTGNVVIPNGYAGVCFSMGSNNKLSTFGATVNQFISGNTREGVYAGASDYIVINHATLIGVAGDGISAAGNNRQGIFLDQGTTNSTIYPGKVVYNGLAGIAVGGDSSTWNDLEPVLIRSNVGLAIDLGNDGHTANGAHTPPGPNNWMNYPELNILGAGSFSGTACAGCQVRFYRTIGNPIAGYGGGEFLSSVTANTTTGDFSYTFPPGVPAVTMLAVAPTTYDTSEMSPSVTNTMNYIFLPLVRRQ